MVSYSLKGKRTFQRVFKQGKQFGNRHFYFYYIDSQEEYNYLGIIVSKKVSKKAVVRNRVRRRIREAYRLAQPEIKHGYYMIIIAKNRCAEASYAELTKSLSHLFYKTHLENKKRK